ncbi:hypothetical protein C8R46DRAFT_1229844 [Mycena filopes]|nr:hypothetical protein C8R46DRAFT_1229844 [Mycena filopes]
MSSKLNFDGGHLFYPSFRPALSKPLQCPGLRVGLSWVRCSSATNPRLFNPAFLVLKALLELFKVDSAGVKIDKFKISRVILALFDANYTYLSAKPCEIMLETYRTIRVEFHPQLSTTMYPTCCRARQPTPQLTQISTGVWLDCDGIEPASTRALAMFVWIPTFNFKSGLDVVHAHPRYRDNPRLIRVELLQELPAAIVENRLRGFEIPLKFYWPQ